MLKAVCDWYRYHTGFNPLPGVFGYYENPAYRILDFLIGYTGFLMVSKWNWRGNSYWISLFQLGTLAAYFISCRVFGKVWEPIPFILLAFILIYACTLQGGILDKIFGDPMIVHLGNISFELYIVHQVLITLLSRKLMNVLGHNGIITMLVLFLLSIIVAEFFYWKPVKRFLTKTVYGR